VKHQLNLKLYAGRKHIGTILKEKRISLLLDHGRWNEYSPEVSGTNYQPTPRNIPEEQRPHYEQVLHNLYTSQRLQKEKNNRATGSHAPVPTLYDIMNLGNSRVTSSEMLHSQKECFNWFCADAVTVRDIATHTYTHNTPSTLFRFVAWSP
jgi:hypothetical protein